MEIARARLSNEHDKTYAWFREYIMIKIGPRLLFFYRQISVFNVYCCARVNFVFGQHER